MPTVISHLTRLLPKLNRLPVVTNISMPPSIKTGDTVYTVRFHSQRFRIQTVRFQLLVSHELKTAEAVVPSMECYFFIYFQCESVFTGSSSCLGQQTRLKGQVNCQPTCIWSSCRDHLSVVDENHAARLSHEYAA